MRRLFLKSFWGLSGLILGLFPALLALSPTWASDHADPVPLEYPESNITGLFLFPQDDRMILVLNIRRALRKAPPYDLEPFVYEINFDLTTPINFDKEPDLARYGGTVRNPENISANAKIRLQLDNYATLKDPVFTGLRDTDKITKVSGVFDDPFIFPRFFERNVISMVLSVPFSAFPPNQRDFIVWATSSRDGKLLDHVGRSLRSQLPRFGLLNGKEPKDHVRALMDHKTTVDGIYNFLLTRREWWPRAFADLLQFTFLIRSYDLQPDVMIYNRDRNAGFPNGRLLTDDVVAQLCAAGDCLLQELSYFDGAKAGWPRATKNDKQISTTWPFLAEKWPTAQEPAPPTDSIWPYLIVALVVIALVFWGLVEIVRRLIVFVWRRSWGERSLAA